jgi:uncharacterized protein
VNDDDGVRRVPTTYDCVITHERRGPVRNRFRYRTRAWLVDLDRPPRLSTGLAFLMSFEARDHLGPADGSLRSNVDAFLAAHDIDLAGGRVLMLANARAFGHVFNPISLHWCYRADGTLAAVIAEVHNTYGDRHAYLLHPGADGRVDERVAKQMYVSPFNPLDGSYRIRVSTPANRVSVSVTLDRVGQPALCATMHGRTRPSRGVLAAAVSSATTSLRVSTLIRWQGVRLVARGLRVERRPVHPIQQAVQ